MADTEHTPGPWTIYDDGGEEDSSDIIMAWIDDEDSGEKYDISAMLLDRPIGERKANARLIASCPDLLHAIEVAGRIVGQVLDTPTMTAGERSDALSGAWYALGPIYFKVTGTPLEWWQCEQSIANAKGGAR